MKIKFLSQYGLYTEPIFGGEGGFPKELVARVAEKSAAQGYPRSRIPEFTDEEREFVRGTSDFFGVNHYFSYYVSASEYLLDNVVPSLLDDINVGTFFPEEWPSSVFGSTPVSITVISSSSSLSTAFSFPMLKILSQSSP